jgi:predicted nuclease with TOPRIM domain
MPVISVITNNYQDRGEDLQTRFDDLQKEHEELVKKFQLLQMDFEEDEEMIKTANDRIKKLESENRGLRVKVAKGKKEEKENEKA